MKALTGKHMEWRLLWMLGAFYFAVGCMEVFRVSYLGQKGSLLYSYTKSELLLIYSLDWMLVVFFMGIMVLLTKWLLGKRFRWIFIILIHTLFAITLSFLTGFITPLVKSNQMYFQFQNVITSFLSSITTNFLIYSSMILIIYAYFYLKEIKEERNRIEYLESSLLKLKIKVLESQLHPHFLFNTLNGISSLIPKDSVAAQNMVADLSEFLRKVLEINNYDLITVDKELNILGYYSNLLKERFQEDLTIEQDISPHCTHCLLPGLLLQPLVENAVKHGYSLNNKTLEVKLRIYYSNGKLHIKVENNGKPVPKGMGKENYGIGLQNVEDRLKAYYKNNYVLTVQNTDYGVLTYIQIPC